MERLRCLQGFNKLMQEQKDKNKENVMVAKKGFMGVDQLNELEAVRKVPTTNVCLLKFWRIKARFSGQYFA